MAQPLKSTTKTTPKIITTPTTKPTSIEPTKKILEVAQNMNVSTLDKKYDPRYDKSIKPGGATRTDANGDVWQETVNNMWVKAKTAPSQNIVSQQPSIMDQINALNQAKQAQAIANLGKARDTQLSNLSGEEASIKPMYYDKRNTTAASNIMGRRTLAEELAARGETRSGVADQANINANMSLQGETGLLNRQEAADISDIARRRTGVQNAYESDVASARANLEAVAMQNLIDQYNADRQFKLQESGVTGTYNGGQTLDALNANRNFALNQAGVTGTYNGIPTLTAQNQTFNQNMATQQYNQTVNQQKLDNLYRQQTFDYQKSRDAVSDNQWQQSMNLNLRQQSFDEAQQKISNALSQKRISQEDASQALQWARFNAEQDPNSLDNQLKKANLDANTYAKETAALNDTIQRLDSLYTYKDASGVPTRNPNYTDAQLRNAIIGLNLSDNQTDTLLLRYGLPIN